MEDFGRDWEARQPRQSFNDCKGLALLNIGLLVSAGGFFVFAIHQETVQARQTLRAPIVYPVDNFLDAPTPSTEATPSTAAAQPQATLSANERMAIDNNNRAIREQIGHLGGQILDIYYHPNHSETRASRVLSDGSQSLTVKTKDAHGQHLMSVIVRPGVRTPTAADITAVNLDAIEPLQLPANPGANRDVYVFQASETYGVNETGYDAHSKYWKYVLEATIHDDAGNLHASHLDPIRLTDAFNQASAAVATMNQDRLLGSFAQAA